jgi:phospholipase/lecithinase/hemolysin
MKKLTACVIAVVFSLIAVVAYGEESNSFSAIVVFGDSMSDTGNLYLASEGTARPWPPYFAGPPFFTGRITNGPVWVEHLANRLGLPAPAPSLLGGTNYAWAGAQTGGGISCRGTPNLGMQIQSFLDDADQRARDDQLFVICAGGNDLLCGNLAILPDEVAANIADHIRTLAAAGAEHFLVPDLFRLGQVPFIVGTPEEQLADQWTIELNLRLSIALQGLERELDITVTRPSFLLLFEAMIRFPGLFGFENVTGMALVDNPVDPDTYLFFDTVHATRVAHEIMGELAAYRLCLRDRLRD